MPDVTSGGVRIYYEVEGHGTPLVLQHGFTMSSARWRETGYVDALKDDYRVILVDARGHGRSDKPHDSEAYSHRQMAADVLAVLNGLGVEQAHYWGYSMGGLIGFRLTRAAPHRVRSLIIGGTHPFALSSSQMAEIDAMRHELRQGIEVFVAGWERRHGTMPPAVRAEWLAQDGPALAAVLEGTRPESQAGVGEPFDDLAMPCLLYGGTADVFASEVPRAAEVLPRASFFMLGGLDHGEAFRDRDGVLPNVVAFLQQVGTAQDATTRSR